MLRRKEVLEGVEGIITNGETIGEIIEDTITIPEEAIITGIKITETEAALTITVGGLTTEILNLIIILVDKIGIRQIHMDLILLGWPKTLANVEIPEVEDIQGVQGRIMTKGSKEAEDITLAEVAMEDTTLRTTKEINS